MQLIIIEVRRISLNGKSMSSQRLNIVECHVYAYYTMLRNYKNQAIMINANSQDQLSGFGKVASSVGSWIYV